VHGAVMKTAQGDQVELGDQQQPAVGRRIQVAGKLGDAGFEFLLRQVGNAAIGVFHDVHRRTVCMYSIVAQRTKFSIT
jgi:hypothetical protein